MREMSAQSKPNRTSLSIAPDPKFSDFYVPPPSKKKDGEFPRTVSFVLAGSVHRDIEVLLTHNGQKFPWQTFSDFMRWAAEHGLEYAAKSSDSGSLVNAAARRRAVYDAVMMQKMRADFIHQMDAVEEAMHDMVLNGHTQPVVENLLKLKASIKNDMGDDPYWQGVYAEEFDRRFEKYLKRVSLTKFSEDES